MQNIYIYSNTQQFVQTLAHTYWRQSRQTKYVSKTTQLHDKILYFKIHLSLFLAKSIIASKNRPKHLIKKWQLLYILYIVHLTSECRRIVLKNVLLKIETSPRVRKYFLNGLVLFFTVNVFRCKEDLNYWNFSHTENHKYQATFTTGSKSLKHDLRSIA